MPGLRLYSSNRLEVLVAALARVLAQPLSSPLAKEVIVVQSKGMERWLSMHLATHLGILSNCAFPFPNAFIENICERVLTVSKNAKFTREAMTWAIMKLLPDHLGTRRFERIRFYLHDDVTGLKQYRLCRYLAETFDQYLVFRPEMILDWDRDNLDHFQEERDREMEAWQAVLWRELSAGGGDHRAHLRARLFKEIQAIDPKLLPERVSVFGISYLPPFHLEFLHAISSSADVHFFQMNPCREFWFDIRSEREQTRMSQGYGGDRGDLYLEEGNSLLASMGRQVRAFLNEVYSHAPQDLDLYEDIPPDTILHTIQADILDLKDASKDGRIPIDDADHSIQVHSCHSPSREVEVLHDNLLALFEEDHSLKAEDILVMAPDIELYASLIEAVFSHGNTIPYSIADRGILKRQVFDAFFAILDLFHGRFYASEVLSILEAAPVRRRFRIEEEDLTVIQGWIEDTRIRWGFDAGDKEARGLPAVQENTWRSGLDRLLLGYAIQGRGEKVFEGILPYDDMEGDSVLLFDAFLACVMSLFTYARSFGQMRTLQEWAVLLTGLVEDLFDREEDVAGINALRHAIRGLAEAFDAGYDKALGLNVIKEALQDGLKQEVAKGFMARGVTFCALLPMRSIPFRVVYLLGMNIDAYPRRDVQKGFDLMALRPRMGDRSKREDDRYLFLETIISARDILCISYVGQDIKDNSPIPPSVLLSELLEYLEKRFTRGDVLITDHIVRRHRLQAFSPSYFMGKKKFFSYSKPDFDACQALMHQQTRIQRFISIGLPAPGDEWKILDIDTLSRFFENPVRFLLKERLHLAIEEGPSPLEDRENFVLSGLAWYQIRQQMAQLRLRGFDEERVRSLIKADGMLPHGSPGDVAYRDVAHDVGNFIETVASYTHDLSPEPSQVELELRGFRISGSLMLSPSGLISYRCAKVKSKDLIRVWIRHLVLNTVRPEGRNTSYYIGTDKVFEFQWVEGSAEILPGLLDLYLAGLVRPLHFFPESSLSYVEAVIEGKNPKDALKKAKRVWRGDVFSRGEAEDVYYHIYPGELDPLDGAFEKISFEILESLKEHCREVGL